MSSPEVTVSGIDEDSNGSVIHFTSSARRFAVERKDNWYESKIKSSMYPIIHRDPTAVDADFLTAAPAGAPVTAYNDWPKEQINNASIFEYLLDCADGQPYKEFYDFVKNWYQSACAIVYCPEQDDPVIIGSGTLIDWETVVTARHNFEFFPIDRLYARFFLYNSIIKSPGNCLRVNESYLDIPVINKYHAELGRDAGYLKLPSLALDLFKQYAKVLPRRAEAFTSNIPAGHYAMFHFAGGDFLVSIGEVNDGRLCELHNQISIQAGFGASGATIIWKGLDPLPIGCGISVYRIVNDRVQRRIISFSHFSDRAGEGIDEISAPYRTAEEAVSIIFRALDESGYEFLRYTPAAYARVEHPNHDCYMVKKEFPRHCNHHIIPIENLLFLWDYFQKLPKDHEKKICERIDEEAKEKLAKIEKEYQEHIRINCSSDGQVDLEASLTNWKSKKKECNLTKQEIARIKKIKIEEAVKKLYSTFHEILTSLCPLGNVDRTWFAWSFWNLFNGWKIGYRTDDPCKDLSSFPTLDFSEKTKPLHFPLALWGSLKNPENGVHYKIEQLKKASCSHDTRSHQAAEASLLASLKSLSKIWRDTLEENKTIYPYHEDEWQKANGRFDGHPRYKLR